MTPSRRRTAEEEFVFDDDALDPTGVRPTARETDGTADGTDTDDTAIDDADADDQDDDTDTNPDTDTGIRPRRGGDPAATPAPRRPVLLLALVAVVVAAMVAVGVVLLVGAAHRGDDGSDNQALVDQATTTQVIGEVSQAVDQIFTYDYANPQTSQQAAANVLVGDASSQYTTLFQALQQKAPGQQLTLTAKTVKAGVSSLTGNTAQLLVFLNQSSTRASDNVTSSSAAQLRITAVRVGGNWKISELQPL